MRKQIITLATAGLLMCHCVSGQVAVKPGGFFNAATGVSNEGVVCGYPDFGDPYELWSPETDEIEVIGGHGPGYGIGSRGIFSSNGKYLSGASEKTIAMPQDWQRKVFNNKSYSFKDIVATPEAWFMVGTSSEGKGDVLSGSQWNNVWAGCFTEIFEILYPERVNSLVSISSIGFDTLFVAGGSTLARSNQSGRNWMPMVPVSSEVASYLFIDFYGESIGVVGALLNGNEYAVYSTRDGGNSWLKATGLSGTPVAVTHAGTTYYLVTKEGKIWQSDHKGEAWTELASVSNEPRRIKFYDENTGAIMAKGAVYFTKDKGVTWSPVEVAEGVTAQINWNDIAWRNKDKIYLVGTKDVIYTSDNGGTTWTWANKELSNGTTELFSVTTNERYVHACGDNSTLYKKNLMESVNFIEISRYDVENKEWRQFGNLGGSDNNVLSGGFSISGDGKTVVGNSYVAVDENDLYEKEHLRIPCRGVAWSEEEGLMDLGSLSEGGNTRADAVSEDGSVIVGYQTWKTGEWTPAVWKKNPQGGYLPNEYILIDPDGAVDYSNMPGYCNTVSANGKWVGGKDNYYNSSSWIWSEETGLINLDMYGPLHYISDDGTIVWGATGVWTKETGTIAISDYLKSVGIDVEAFENEGIQLGAFILQGVSKNGRYMAGATIVNNLPATIRIDLNYKTGIKNNAVSGQISVSQNFVSDGLVVELPAEEARLALFDMQGREIKAQSCTTGQAFMPVSDLSEGLYILNVATEKVRETFKIQISR